MADAFGICIGMPRAIAMHGQSTAYTTTNLSTQNDGAGMIFRMPEAATITHIGYRQGTTTGTPAAGSYTATIMGMTNAGIIDGTDKGGGTPTAATFTPAAANDATWQWIALTNSYAAAADETLAFVIQRNAATDAANFMQIAGFESWTTIRPGVPYGNTKAGAGAWTKVTSTFPVFGAKSSSKSYGFPQKNIFLSQTIGSTAEGGMYFTIPSGWCSSVVLLGVRCPIVGAATTGTGTYRCNAYSGITGSTPTILASSNAVDNDEDAALSANRNKEFYFTSPPTLTAGTEYGVAFSTTTVNDITMPVLELSANTDRTAWQFAEQAGMMNRTISAYPPTGSDGAFTKTDTKRPWLELILGDITAPAGGGGGMLFVPDLAGT